MKEKIKLVEIDIEISGLRGKSLDKRINDYIKKHNKIICKGLNKRPIFIDEYLYFINSRNSGDKNHRKMSFFSGIDLIKKVQSHHLTNLKISGGKKSYEFKGITKKGKLVGVHIVEYSNGKDKKLKLISTFWDQKKT